MSRLTISQRMLVCLLSLVIPICLFVYMLVEEVNKNIDTAKKEIVGVHVQQPLVELQVGLLQIYNQHVSGVIDQAAIRQSAEALKNLQQQLQEHQESVGLGAVPLSPETDTDIISLTNSQTWDDATTGLVARITAVLNADKAALDQAGRLAAAVNAMIARVSDGSGLTLDPDVDSYYLMDMAAFALPELFDHFATSERMLLHWATVNNKTNSPEEMTETVLARHALADDEGQHVIRSYNMVKNEDANYYGASPTLKRLDPLITAYRINLKNAVDNLNNAIDGGKLPDVATIKATSARGMDDALQLTKIGQEELIVLLNNRIQFYEEYRADLLFKMGFALVLGLALFFFVVRSIVKPLKRLNTAMVVLAGGKHDIEIPDANQTDEVGQMAKALVVFKQNAAFIDRVGREFENSVIGSVEMVAAVAKEIDVAARDLTTQAGEGHVRLAELCKDIEAVSGGSREISAAGEQLKAAINEISAQVSVSAGTTAKAAEQAVHVRDTALMLEQATAKISDVVTIISSITSKITLLALNATIESARAGEAGKGFAVVASEVKLLARQTEESTSEIAQAVSAIQQSSAMTLSAIQSIGDIIRQLSEGSTVIAAAVEEQGAVADNIAQNMSASTNRLENVASTAKALIDLTANSSAAATQSMQASIEFADQFDKLRTEVQQFVGVMRGENKAA